MQPTGPSFETMKRLVCQDCSWKTESSTDEDRERGDRAAVDHHATTGHSIEASNASRAPRVDTVRWVAPTAVRGQADD